MESSELSPINLHDISGAHLNTIEANTSLDRGLRRRALARRLAVLVLTAQYTSPAAITALQPGLFRRLADRQSSVPVKLTKGTQLMGGVGGGSNNGWGQI